MSPQQARIYIAPFCDRDLYTERKDGAQFWNQSVYGVSLHGLEDTARDQLFAQPVVGYFKPEILLTGPGQSAKHLIDFSTCSSKSLENCEFPFSWKIARTELMHGYACWFDVKFWLGLCSISDDISSCSGTHWYQSRLLFKEPIGSMQGKW